MERINRFYSRFQIWIRNISCFNTNLSRQQSMELEEIEAVTATELITPGDNVISPANEVISIDPPEAVESHPKWRPDVRRTAAVAILLRQGDGTFIIRNRSLVDGYAISFNVLGNVYHAPFTMTQFARCRLVCFPNHVFWFNSLSDLLKFIMSDDGIKLFDF